MRRQVKAERREAAPGRAEQPAVQVNLGDLTHGLELDEHLLALPAGRGGEGFPIPGAAAPLLLLAAVAGQRPVVEGVGVVVGVRGGYGGPRGVVETWRLSAGRVGLHEFPVGVEVDRLAAVGQSQPGQQHEEQGESHMGISSPACHPKRSEGSSSACAGTTGTGFFTSSGMTMGRVTSSRARGGAPRGSSSRRS